MAKDDPPPRIIDASVLIQLLAVDEEVILLSGQHVAPLSVPVCIFEETNALTEAKAKKLRLEIFREELDHLLEAAANRGQRGLSFEDWTVFILARENGWGVVTNDGPLQKICREASMLSTCNNVPDGASAIA